MGGAYPPAGTDQVPGQSPPCVRELCTTLRGTKEGTVEGSGVQVRATGGVPRATRCIQRATGCGGGSLWVHEGPLGVCRDYCGVHKGILGSVLGATGGLPGATECVQGTTGVCTVWWAGPAGDLS